MLQSVGIPSSRYQLFHRCFLLESINYNILTRPWCNFLVDGCRRRLKFLPPDDGHYLADHVFLNLTTGIYTPCHHRCVMESRCVSISMGALVNDKVVCELSDSDHIQHPQHFKPRQGWSYRGITEVPMTIRFKTYEDKPTTAADCMFRYFSIKKITVFNKRVCSLWWVAANADDNDDADDDMD